MCAGVSVCVHVCLFAYCSFINFVLSLACLKECIDVRKSAGVRLISEWVCGLLRFTTRLSYDDCDYATLIKLIKQLVTSLFI